MKLSASYKSHSLFKRLLISDVTAISSRRVLLGDLASNTFSDACLWHLEAAVQTTGGVRGRKLNTKSIYVPLLQEVRHSMSTNLWDGNRLHVSESIYLFTVLLPLNAQKSAVKL